ncbi:type VI secretion system Vgr family protein [Herbaspirillum huttiense]|uniref:type VI secretion system Vgr family protein n=1 Tax=Herbaspirillum huttiense TaxID=863372 RepID=UPI002877D062|nr:type VI secretion system tip protein TssI/VgrG [Herbaspirillum huttiense]
MGMASFDEILKSNKRFAFSSDAFKAEVAVVSLTGREAISQMFRFELILVSADANVDFDAMLAHPATLQIFSADGSSTTPYHGMLAEFELLQQVDKNFTFYRAVLVPHMWRLSLNRISDVYLGSRKTPDLIKLVLDTDKTLKYDIKATATYYARDFVCQHMETHVDFLSRWMERDGLYYYFTHDDKADTITILDAKEGHAVDTVTVEYRPADKLDTGVGNRSVQAFIGNQRPLPKTVTVYDYDYANAKVSFKFEHDVSALNSAVGEIMLQGEHIRSDEEGKRYAALRAQELVCNGKQFAGESTVVGLRSGYFMEMRGHYRDAFNAKYLVTEIEHRGSQAGALLNGLDTPYNRDKSAAPTHYANSFHAIAAEVQFRPPRVTPWPQLTGTMSAVIDSASSNKIADLDDMGRYLVKLRFNKTDRQDGAGSVRIRMASGYAGTVTEEDGTAKTYGMHAPLHKGAEVLLSFEGGDPDRPVIMSAVANSENPNVVNQKNSTQTVLQTVGNSIVLEDQEGTESVKIISAGNSNDKTVIGYGNEAKGIWASTSGSSVSMSAGSSTSVSIGVKNSLSASIENSISASLGTKASVGASIGVSYGRDVSWKFGRSFSLDDSESVSLKTEGKLQGNDNVLISGGQRKLIKDTVDTLKSALKKAVKVNVLVNMAVAAGASAGMALKSDAKGGKIPAFDWWNASFSGAQAALNTLVTAGSIYHFALNKSADALAATAKEEAYVSNMKLGQSGIEMTADSLPVLAGVLPPGNKRGMVNIETGTVAITAETKGLKKSSIDLNSDKISLAASDAAQMSGTLDLTSSTCTLASNNPGASIVLKHNLATAKLTSDGFLAKSGKAAVAADPVQGASISMGKASVTTTAMQAVAEFGKSSMTLNATSASLEMGTNTLSAGASGVTINGSMIRVG